jgi:hypothetical protein
MSSAAEAKVGALLKKPKEAVPLCTALKEMGHPPPAPKLWTCAFTGCGIESNKANSTSIEPLAVATLQIILQRSILQLTIRECDLAIFILHHLAACKGVLILQ